MVSPNNFIYFFTVCGFFIGLIFTIINFTLPEDIILYTAEITLFFYLFIHIVIMNFVDIKRFGVSLFNKKEYEEISEYFVGELDVREKRMDSLLLEVEKMNIKYEQETKQKKEPEVDAHKKAA
ncbi:membrane protein [Sulfurospirillum arcachonense]|uniref:membrane protein n=1 Tax=Sulfurospirillum arcachonense TaxID=57666 RepID=UPI0004698760|nr:membrane protein [Sulfurospirillum arcachonense]